PNVALFLLPHHLFTLVLRPDGPARTIESADLLVHPDSLEAPGAEARCDAIVDFWGMVNVQYIAAVERVQRGLRARAYRGGRVSFRCEEPIRGFQNMILALMTGRRRIPAGDETACAPRGPSPEESPRMTWVPLLSLAAPVPATATDAADAHLV